jgi:hypothetical protein
MFKIFKTILLILITIKNNCNLLKDKSVSRYPPRGKNIKLAIFYVKIVFYRVKYL